MTRNEHILLIMSWARSFHGLSLDDCVHLAERVLDDDFNGSIADADPAKVMSCMDKQYFKANFEGEVFVDAQANVPTWEEHGFVRVPISTEPGTIILSDNTTVQIGMLDQEPLVLESGGVIPIMAQELQDVIMPIVFSDPKAVTQENIDNMIENPPPPMSPKNYIQRASVDLWDKIKDDYVEMLRDGWQPPHNHEH